MEALGIKDDLDWMLDNLGWIDLMNFRFPTYQRLTLEFLSSLDVHYTTDEWFEGKISFRLLNNEYTWTLSEFNDCFRLPTNVTRNFDKRFSSTRFWKMITDAEEPYDASKSKASWLQNPVFRYLHRVMTKTIFGRAESDGVVRKLELYCIWAMLHQVEFNTGFHFLQNLVKIANSSTGVIVVGGLITVIASVLGCHFENLECVAGNSKVDMETCLAMKMICKSEGGYAFNIINGFPYPLPLPPTVTVRVSTNWILRPPVPSHTSTPVYEQPYEHAHETTYHPESSYHEPHHPDAEPYRRSFAYGEGGSAFDFSALRGSLDTLHDEHTTFQDQLGQYGTMRREQFKEIQDHFTKADEFYTTVDKFMGRQYQEWNREAEFRRSMDLTRRQIDALYQYHEHLGTVPRLPKFPPPGPPPYDPFK